MNRRGNTRYPHAFSKGRGVMRVADGSWRLAPDDPRRTLYDHRPASGFLSANIDHTLSSLVARKLCLGIRCPQCRPGRDKVMPPLEAVASYGGLITFEEVKTVLQGRCKKERCELSVFVSRGLVP